MTDRVKIKVDYIEKGKTKTKTIHPPRASVEKYKHDLMPYLRGYLFSSKPVAWDIVDK